MAYFAPESPAGLPRNRWPLSIGISGRFGPEYAPPGHSSALLRSVPIKRPQKRNRSSAQAELCLNAFRHALPNPKNAPFTTIHTTASLDLDRIDSETLRKPFRPAKITFISKSVIYAG